ncbi:polyprenyl synthetase family protein [Lolliginicoccus levis]|uniref:polyprenyl synthetase family protein n=1 Tax=Lolliginicoccus levis TaxID=2919542 RepID=UPI00241C1996|nr:polyprenyl synthetase family protein [Lolliginicoccus levis]
MSPILVLVATLVRGRARQRQEPALSTRRDVLTARDLPPLVTGALEAFFASRRPLVEPIGPEYAAAMARLEAFVLSGGKRVRPMFAWLGWTAAGGDPTGPDAEQMVSACAALELVQACALIHDDIIDNSDTRRGRPTVHVEFAADHAGNGWSGSADRFGMAAGIITGDLALAWADDMFSGSGLPGPALARARPVWAAMRTEVLGGQLLDIVAEASGDGRRGTAERINRFKTAAYTVERPLHLGAEIAGSDARLIEDLRAFGAAIGVAFQLRDDLLGVFGDPAVTGKPSGDDLIEGKRTELISRALDHGDQHDPAAASRLRGFLGRQLAADGVNEARAILHQLGAVRAIEERIASLTDRALAILETSSMAPGPKRQLQEMALSVTRRDH